MEGNVDHAEELDDLAKEGRLDIFIVSIESLIEGSASTHLSFILRESEIRSSNFLLHFVGNMSVEELLEKYKGAYSSDFEIPSASGSKESSDLEVSGDEEEETEEDESDAASNTSSSGTG